MNKYLSRVSDGPLPSTLTPQPPLHFLHHPDHHHHHFTSHPLHHHHFYFSFFCSSSIFSPLFLLLLSSSRLKMSSPCDLHDNALYFLLFPFIPCLLTASRHVCIHFLHHNHKSGSKRTDFVFLGEW